MHDAFTRVAVWLLPRSRRHWGEAMLAEIDQIDRPWDRWRFAAGCLRVALLPPASDVRFGRIGPAAVLGAAVSVVSLAALSEVGAAARAASGGRGWVYVTAAASFCLVLLTAYSLIALRRLRSATPGAIAGRRYGLGAGAVVGLAALVASTPLRPPGVPALAGLAAVSTLCGLLAARSSGDSRSGRDAGLWAGMLGGLVLIIGLVPLTIAMPTWFAHDPSVIRTFHQSLSPRYFHDYHTHFATVTGFVIGENTDTALVGGLLWLPLLGLLFGSAGGALARRVPNGSTAAR